MAMFDPTLSAVISIDADTDTVHFYTTAPGQTPRHAVANCRCRALDADYFERFDKVIKTFQQKNPMVSLAKTSVILPDHVFLTDLLNIPAIGKKAMENSLELAIGAVYVNKKDLRYITTPLLQNKQFATYSLLGIRKDLLDKLRELCAANQVGLQNVTFTANALVNGAMSLNPKLKNGTFLLLDIQEERARFAFVNKGRTIGYYHLPFGTNMLYKSRFAAEDLLFDHATGELLVLNAKEKAKAKQLTMMGEEIMTDPDAQDPEQSDDGNLFGGPYSDGKKSARKLPKFMQRDIPTDRDGFVYENFRIFVKWALDLIANNPEITALGAMEAVYVNLPSEYGFLYDMVNAEEEENGVKFMPMLAGNAEAGATENLELYGGFFVKQFNKTNNF